MSEKKKILVFDSKPYDIESFSSHKDLYDKKLEFEFQDFKLNTTTASLAKGFDGICVFVNDKVNKAVLEKLKEYGVQLIALRCAGYNNIALKEAKELELKIVRVPEYSPYAVAEHAMTLIMALNRNIHRAYARVRENNFSLNGLIGFDMHNKTIGIIGTGKIGQVMAKISKGFGCKVVAYDKYENAKLSEELGFQYVSLDALYKESDIISLHIPLTPETQHLIDAKAISKMKQDVILINTSRGPLVDTQALIDALKNRKIKAAGLDVYEEEEKYFFEDWSNLILVDDQLARLLSFNNVIVTSHQAFFTEEAMKNIAETTIQNILDYFASKPLVNEVRV